MQLQLESWPFACACIWSRAVRKNECASVQLAHTLLSNFQPLPIRPQLTLLTIPLELCARMPHRIEHGNRSKRRTLVIVKLLKRAVHLAAHAPALAALNVGRACAAGAAEWLAYRQALCAICAHVPVVLVAEKVGLEQGIVDERLEDGREEARLGEVEQGAESWLSVLQSMVCSLRDPRARYRDKG